jgi:hypothetical protein
MPTGPSAAYWRDKAKESRALAAGMNHGPSKETMLGIAADYEKMAKFAEQIEASGRRDQGSAPTAPRRQVGLAREGQRRECHDSSSGREPSPSRLALRMQCLGPHPRPSAIQTTLAGLFPGLAWVFGGLSTG